MMSEEERDELLELVDEYETKWRECQELLYKTMGEKKSLDDFSDDDIINELYKRIGDDKSDILSFRTWTVSDIVDSANSIGISLTNDEAKEVAKYADLNNIESIWEIECDCINDAIKRLRRDRGSDENVHSNV